MRVSKAVSEGGSFLQSPHAIFKNTNPGNFCSRPLFEVIFANELNSNSEELLNGLIEISRKENINTNIFFITRNDLFQFIKKCGECSQSYCEDFEHPPQFLNHLLQLCAEITDSFIENDEISRKQLAQALKHALINKMYTQYAENAKLDHIICKKEETLKKLQKSEAHRQHRLSESNLGVKTSATADVDLNKKKTPIKKTEQPSKLKLTDYMTYSLPDNLTGSDNPRDNVYFYIFTGFQDPCLLKLLVKYQVPVSCILQIAKKEDMTNSNLNYFWRKINEISRNGEKYKMMEDMAHMKFVCEEIIPDENEEKEIFFEKQLNELGDLLVNILHLKRKHLHYIKHLYPYTYPAQILRYAPFPFYERNLKDIPSEFITIPYILHSIITEVENYKNTKDNKELPTIKPSELKCHINHLENENVRRRICPLKLEYFKSAQINEPPPRKKIFRKFYEGDVLNMFLVTDKRTECMVLSDIKILTNQKYLNIMKQYQFLCDIQPDVPHSHHQSAPATKKTVITHEQTNHFLNLLYFSNMRCNETVFAPTCTDSNYLCTLSEFYENKNFLPKCLSVSSEENLYEKFDSMTYRWVEPLSNSILTQWLFKAELEFSTVNFRYCSATNALLILFHHNLTPAGTRTKMWNESLRTVTCFRDFCSFYLFEDEKWLSKYQPLEHVRYESYKIIDEDYIFQRLLESGNPFLEYNKYLIPYNYCDDFDVETRICCEEKERVKKFSNSPKPNLEEIIQELKTYPPSIELINHCAPLKTARNLLALDKRPQRFGLTGTTNEFFSHDGVKITVDTCRFHFEDFKLSLSISFSDNNFFVHYKIANIETHLVLQDGAIIKFNLPKTERTDESDSCPSSEDIDPMRSFFSFREKMMSKTNVSQERISDFYEDLFNNKSSLLFESYERYATPIYNEDLESINLSSDILRNKFRTGSFKKNIEADANILKQLKDSHTCYKYMDYDPCRFKYLTESNRVKIIPYSSILKRILRKPMKVKYTAPNRQKIVVKNYKPASKIEDDVFNIKIRLPNGLLLEFVASNDENTHQCVKQTHLERERFCDISKEDYRLFFNNGIVLIRYLDGNIKLLDSQGVMTEFKAPFNTTYQFSGEKCFKNIQTCRKGIYALMKLYHRSDNQSDKYRRSRRGHLKLSKKLLLKSNLIKILSECNSPFSMVKIFSPEGNILRVRGNAIDKNNFAKILYEFDFMSGESMWTRTDGMKLLFKRNGDQIVVYPDGTKITKMMKVDNELEFFTKRDKYGWVVINNSYLYENIHYFPVEFDNNSNSTIIHFKQNNKLKFQHSKCSIIFGDNSELKIDSENVQLMKICQKCQSGCNCCIKLRSGDFENYADEISEKFLICTDSYHKEFTSDFQGRCTMNNDYIQGELNKNNCNHFESRDYHKAFLIHDNLSGDLLWNDKMVIREVKRVEKYANKDPQVFQMVRFTTTDKSTSGIKFFKNFYKELGSNYLWTEYMYPLSFTRSEVTSADLEKTPTYQIGRNIFNVVQEKEINELSNIVKKFLKEEDSLKSESIIKKYCTSN